MRPFLKTRMQCPVVVFVRNDLIVSAHQGVVDAFILFRRKGYWLHVLVLILVTYPVKEVLVEGTVDLTLRFSKIFQRADEAYCSRC